jgi:tetratricopeptide (TPR) repeat protein
MDKSLLWQQESEDEPRFFMLQTIHEFALDRLRAAGEVEELRDNHARYFLALVEEAYPKLLGSPQQAEWMGRLESDNDNLRAALSWLVGHQPPVGLRMAVAVARFWRTLGHDNELHQALQSALERGHEAPIEVRVVALREAGEVMQRLATPELSVGEKPERLSYYNRGRQLLEESIRLCRDSGDIKNLAWGLRCLGEGARAQNELDQAQLFFDESLAIERERGDKIAIGNALHYAGSLARDRGDLETAHSLFDESAGLFRQTKDERGLAYSLTHLAAVAFLQGDFSQAHSHYEKSLPIFRKIKDRSGLLWALRFLSEMASWHRDYEAARLLFEERLRVNQDAGAGEGIVRSLCGLVGVARNEGRLTEGKVLMRQLLTMLKSFDTQMSLREPLEGCIQLAAAEGRWERAAHLIGVLPALTEDENPDAAWRVAFQKSEQDTRDALDAATFNAITARSRTLTRAQILSYALEDDTEDAPSSS